MMYSKIAQEAARQLNHATMTPQELKQPVCKSIEPRESTIVDVRLDYSLRAARDMVEYLERIYRAATTADDREAIGDLLADAMRFLKRIAAFIESRGPCVE